MTTHILSSDNSKTLMDPLKTLWETQNKPQPSKKYSPNITGTCSRCNTFDNCCTPIKKVVSDKYTEWDQYTQQKNPLWCTGCVWGHTTPTLRTRKWVITPENSYQPSTEQLQKILDQPIPYNMCVTIPQSLQKHIIPKARWEHISTDNRNLLWNSEQTYYLHLIKTLKKYGYNENDLIKPTPDITKIKKQHIQDVINIWENLEPWRKDSIYLNIAFQTTRKPKQ